MRIRTRQLALSIVTALATLGQAHAAPQVPPAGPVLITADKVWTGEGAPHAGWSVLVAQGRIQAVGRRAHQPARQDPDSRPDRPALPRTAAPV
jgi:hypothetical protein